MEILILSILSSMKIRLNFLVAEKSLISEVNSPPHCVNPLSVAEGKKLRLVLDMREVNRYLVKCNFRYEDLRGLKAVLYVLRSHSGNWQINQSRFLSIIRARLVS